MISFVTLPFPPSANRYWRHPGNGAHLISEEGRRFRLEVFVSLKSQNPGHKTEAGPIAVQIIAHRPDNRRRDLDNLLKATLDALTKAHAWEDDSQIQKLSIEWGTPVEDGRLDVSWSAMEAK